MTCVVPVRKIMSVVWKPAYTKKKRMPSTLIDCMEDSTLKKVASFCRPWLILVLGLALMYNLHVINIMYKFPQRAEKEENIGDIQVLRSASNSSTAACGLGCNLEEVSKTTNTTVADLVALVNFDPKANLRPPPVLCRRGSSEGWEEIRYKLHKLDFKNRQEIKPGGYYKPGACVPRSKVAVIVPYRDRETDLLVFLYNIHPFLINQKLEYRIFVIEQSGHEKFNKGRLFNAGFEQADKFGSWHCLIFHDVNLLPLDMDTSYTCPTVPTQMSTGIVQNNQASPHESRFGGVTAMTHKHFRKVNGYSNSYWGSVGADLENMYWRLHAARLPIKRYNKIRGRYTMLPHPTEKKNPKSGDGWDIWRGGMMADPMYEVGYRRVAKELRNIHLPHGFTTSIKGRGDNGCAPHRHKRISTEMHQKEYKTDGLADSHYKIISIKLRSLYTHIIVDINPNKDLTE